MLERIFTEHPRAVDENYWQHRRAAWFYARLLLAAGLAALVHGLIPCLFTDTASTTVARLHEFGAVRAQKRTARRMAGIAD
jgi:Mg2+/citrate symporter